MKMGTIASPWRYDAAAEPALRLHESATARALVLRLTGDGVRHFAGLTGYPSIEVLSISLRIDRWASFQTLASDQQVPSRALIDFEGLGIHHPVS